MVDETDNCKFGLFTTRQALRFLCFLFVYRRTPSILCICEGMFTNAAMPLTDLSSRKGYWLTTSS